MSQQDEPVIAPTLGERARGEVERIVDRGSAVLTMGTEELAAILDGVQQSVEAALGERQTEHNVAPAFALGAVFGVVLTLLAVAALILLLRVAAAS